MAEENVPRWSKLLLQWTVYTYAAFMLLTSLRPQMEKLMQQQPKASIGASSSSSIATKDVFDWSSITPKKHLEYHPCFDGHQCARLDVPMDWNATREDPEARVAVAIIKRPAKVPVTDPRYGGAVLLNPGGPGGSGVSFLIGYGKSIQTIVDAAEDPDASYNPWASDSKYFDTMSFDPRGINNTTPQIICFPSTFQRQSWSFQQQGEGLLGSSDRAFDESYARSVAVGAGCATRIGMKATGGPGIGAFVTTANVVADMVEIIEQHGAWREVEAKRLLAQSDLGKGLRNRRSLQTIASRPGQVLDKTRWQKGSEKLLYWGFSYGTVLGATFAAMQPNRVGRLAIDGVCDSEDYYSGRWLRNIMEADAIHSRFFDFCLQAGPEKCAFTTKGDSKIEINARFDKLLEGLKSSPVPVPASPDGNYGPDIIKYDDVRGTIFSSLYSPLQKYPPLASALFELSQGNGTLFSIQKSEHGGPFCPRGNCGKSPEPYSPSCQLPGSNDEVSYSILCSDGDEVGRTKETYKILWQKTRQQSGLFGDVWSHIHTGCTGWKIRPKWRFTGPFTANTSHPLLWLGNTGDPVTPVVNAHKMASGFPSSIVLTQNSDGHCTVAAPSLCTAKHVRRYFQSGTLPPAGTVCEVDELPFVGNVSSGDNMRVLTEEDRVLLEAMREAPVIEGFLKGL